LTQISFITTAAKYIVALLLSVDAANQSMEEQTTISKLLITLDVFFMSSSVIAIGVAVWVLRVGIKKIQNSKDFVVAGNDKLTQIVPIAAVDNDDSIFGGNNSSNSGSGSNDTNAEQPVTQQRPHRIRSLAFTPAQHLGHFGAEHREAQNIHDSFHIHEEGLRNRTAKRQQRAKRQTQLRLKARRKLKDSKALHQFPTFSNLSDDEVNTLIDQMDHITRFKNDAICHQHDISDSFYIIVKGSAVATVDDDATDDQEIEFYILDDDTKCRTTATTCPEQIEVGRIDVLGFFGEGSLIKDGDGDGTCSATVTVVSDRCELLRLKRKAFLEMNESSTTFQTQHDDHKSVLEQLKDVKMERTKSNRVLLERRRSSKKMKVLSMNGEEKEEEEDTSIAVSVKGDNGSDGGGEEGERKDAVEKKVVEKKVVERKVVETKVVVRESSEGDDGSDDGNSNLAHFLKFGW